MRKRIDNDMHKSKPDMISIHESEKFAEQWAQLYCFLEHGECVSYSDEALCFLRGCAISEEVVYGRDDLYLCERAICEGRASGRDDFLFSNVFFIRSLVERKEGPPSFPSHFKVTDSRGDSTLDESDSDSDSTVSCDSEPSVS